MMSPDGKWVWDGQKWIPVAVHESVFPAYASAGAAAASADPAAPLAETMVSPPVNPFAGRATPSPFATPPQGTPFAGPPPTSAFVPMPVPAPAVVSPPIVQPGNYAAGGATPPWQAWAGGGADRSRMMKLGAAFIAVALGVIVVIYFGLSQLPFMRASNEQPTPAASPTATPVPQLTARSDAAVATRWVTAYYTPAINALSAAVRASSAACNGVLSVSCQQALKGLDDTLKPTVAALAQPVPPCIAKPVGKVRADVNAIQAAVTHELQSFDATNVDQLRVGIKNYNIANRSLTLDAPGVVAAQVLCDGQPSGP